MKRKSTVNRLYTRPVLTKALRVPNELSYKEPVNPLLKHPLERDQPDQTPLKTGKKHDQENLSQLHQIRKTDDMENEHGI